MVDELERQVRARIAAKKSDTDKKQ
jgi:hypothetical protein